MIIDFLTSDGKIERKEVEVLAITSVDTPHIICFDKAPGVTQLITSDEKEFQAIYDKTIKIFKHKDLG